MKNVLIALMLVLVTASLKAITIQWSVPNSAAGWQNKFHQAADGADLGVYFVYSTSTTPYTSASAVWTNKNAEGNQVVSVKAGDDYPDTYINGKENSGATLSIDVSSNAASTTRFALQLDATLTDTSFAPGGYFYLVVFNPDANDSEYGHYAVSNAAKYTAAAEATAEATAAATAANNALGIYTTTAGEDPLVGNFIEIGWMGGNWTAVPEPTALALLALGVAGLALRRKL